MSINIPVWEGGGGGAPDSLVETPVTPFLNPAPTLAAGILAQLHKVLGLESV